MDRGLGVAVLVAVGGAMVAVAAASLPSAFPNKSPAFHRLIFWGGLSAALGMFGLAGWIAWAGAAPTLRPGSDPIPRELPPTFLGGPNYSDLRSQLVTGHGQDASTAAWMGRSVRVSGTIHEHRSENGAETWVIYLTPKGDDLPVYALFDGSKYNLAGRWGGDHITADCKFERLDSSGIGLRDCAPIAP